MTHFFNPATGVNVMVGPAGNYLSGWQLGSGQLEKSLAKRSHPVSDVKDSEAIVLRLTPAEALVLFEWLARVDNAGDLPVEDPAEQQVLWRLEGQLESQVTEVLLPNYKELVEAARREVRGDELRR